jgi:hypothetical protein
MAMSRADRVDHHKVELQNVTSLRERAHQLVADGVRDGVVVYDQGTGLAVLSKNVTDLPSSEARKADLECALELGSAQEVALEALKIELRDAGVYPAMGALEAQACIALAATGRVSTRAHERVRGFLERDVRLRTRALASSAPAWFGPLVNIFHLRLWESIDPAAEHQLDNLLELLKQSIGELESLPTLSPEKRRDAEEFLQKVRVGTIKPEFQPRAKAGGAPLTPWAAARAFAEKAFGIEVPKESNGKRPRKLLE